MRLIVRLCATVLSIALCSSSVLSEELSEQITKQDIKSFKVKISNRKVIRETNVIRVVQGDTVSLIWYSDEKTQLHLHGYDIEFEVVPNTPKTITFNATASGRFSITSHAFSDDQRHGHEALLYLEVYPK